MKYIFIWYIQNIILFDRFFQKIGNWLNGGAVIVKVLDNPELAATDMDARMLGEVSAMRRL
jgi:hypothetical protein